MNTFEIINCACIFTIGDVAYLVDATDRARNFAWFMECNEGADDRVDASEEMPALRLTGVGSL